MTLIETGNRFDESWTVPSAKSDFFLFKGYVESVLSRLGIQKHKTQPVKADIFGEGIALYIGSECLVEFGTVKKSILKHFDIKQEVLFADFNWEAVHKLVSNKVKFADIAKYPEMRRDLALLLDKDVTFENVYRVAKLTEKSLLKNINLFDVYEGDKLPEGKKSYAVSFVMQDNSKTLTDVQIDKVMSKIMTQLKKELGAIQR